MTTGAKFAEFVAVQDDGRRLPQEVAAGEDGDDIPGRLVQMFWHGSRYLLTVRI